MIAPFVADAVPAPDGFIQTQVHAGTGSCGRGFMRAWTPSTKAPNNGREPANISHTHIARGDRSVTSRRDFLDHGKFM
jgi:hypothetical protein